MATNNRATQLNKVIKVVKRQFKPVDASADRSLLDHLLFACCLENSLHEQADQVFNSLTQDFFDWNEVRVTSIRELKTCMKPLNDPNESATRLKRVLHSVFECHYSFDLEPMKKQNIGQTVKQIEKYNGSTPFMVAYVTQNALGGHSIPVNAGLLESMRIIGIVSDAEAAKGRVPGLERLVPKTKGIEIGSLLHQLGVELHRSPLGPNIRKYLLEIDPSCKDRLPKRPSKKAPPEPEQPAKSAKKAKPDAEASAPKSKPAAAASKKKETASKKVVESKKTAPKKKAAAKKSASKTAPKKTTTKKKAAAKKKPAAKKKAAKKKTATKKAAKKKSVTKRLTKKKPR